MAQICYFVDRPWSKKRAKPADYLIEYGKHLKPPVDDDTLKRRAMLMALANGGEIKSKA